ncbi:MAG: exo-alpha-sialidase [Euryarchaeota archaeon]|nr:exo-alpha-sialidase [Euryarchaeota archaeon]
MRRGLLAVALAAVASACVSPGNDLDAGATVPSILVPGPDEAAFRETQGREFDMVADRDDPSKVTAAYVIPRQDSNFPSWLALAKSSDGGRTWRTYPFCGDPATPAPSDVGCPFLGARLTSDPVLLQARDGTLLYLGVMLNAQDVTQFVARFDRDATKPSSVHVISRSAFNFVDGAQMIPAPYMVYYNGKANILEERARDVLHVVWAADLVGRDDGVPPTIGLPFWTTSRDGGRSWSRPVALTQEAFGDLDSIYAVGVEAFETLDGKLHAIWWESRSNALYQVTSSDGAGTFTAPRKIGPALARPSNAPVNSDNLTRPWTGVDLSGGPRHGTVYVLYDDLSLGDRDLYLLVSTDNATTWSPPTRVPTIPQGNGRDETMARLLVEPDGNISVLYPSWRKLERWSPYEMRLARSTDGAVTFADVRLSSGFSPLHNPGDYNDLVRTPDGVLAVWEDGRGGPAGTKWAFRSLIGLG